MTSALRRAARRALRKAGPMAAEGEVTRLTVDVSLNGTSELVTFALRDGELVWTSTGGSDAPHVAAALRWLALSEAESHAHAGELPSDGARRAGEGAAAVDGFHAASENLLSAGAERALAERVGVVAGELAALTSSTGPAVVRAVSPDGDALRTRDVAPMPRVSWVGGEPAPAEPSPPARTRLADALEDVVTAVVRAGAGEPDSPSVAESLERLRREVPLPTPTGVARWLGRLKEALSAKDVALAARLLEGASHLAQDLRRERPTPAVRRRVVGWMGGSGELGAVERVSDRTLVEVAREWLPSSERGGVERRYLVDLRNGEVFREERSRSSPVASVGPCPRVVNVGLAQVEDSAAPRRIRLMQYVVSLEVGPSELTRIASSAYRRFSALADRYRTWLAEHPGQAEPFAIIAPHTWSPDEPVGYDEEGEPLPFARADDPAAVGVLSALSPPTGPRWIAGRLVDAHGALMIVPCAVAVPDGDGTRLHRLR